GEGVEGGVVDGADAEGERIVVCLGATAAGVALIVHYALDGRAYGVVVRRRGEGHTVQRGVDVGEGAADVDRGAAVGGAAVERERSEERRVGEEGRARGRQFDGTACCIDVGDAERASARERERGGCGPAGGRGWG